MRVTNNHAENVLCVQVELTGRLPPWVSRVCTAVASVGAAPVAHCNAQTRPDSCRAGQTLDMHVQINSCALCISVHCSVSEFICLSDVHFNR